MSSLQPPAPPGGCVSSICAQTIVTLNASITTPDAIIILITSKSIPNMQLMSLVDSGSLDSFIDSGFVEKHHLAAYTIPAIRLCLIDGSCNSIITQAIKLHICFSSVEKQDINFYVTPLDLSCTLMLGSHWLTRYNSSIDWVNSCITFHTNTTSESPPVHMPKQPQATSRPQERALSNPNGESHSGHPQAESC